MSNRRIGYSLVAIAFAVAVLFALSPGVVPGVSSSVFWLLAAICCLVLVIALGFSYGPSLATLMRPAHNGVDELIKEAEWYLEVGDTNEAWQAYVKAKRAYKRLPEEERAGAHERLLVLYGELEKVTKK